MYQLYAFFAITDVIEHTPAVSLIFGHIAAPAKSWYAEAGSDVRCLKQFGCHLPTDYIEILLGKVFYVLWLDLILLHDSLCQTLQQRHVHIQRQGGMVSPFKGRVDRTDVAGERGIMLAGGNAGHAVSNILHGAV